MYRQLLFVVVFVFVPIALVQPAHATSLSGALTADNGFLAFISTNNSVLGTQIDIGSDWGTAYAFSGVSLTPGQNYFLQIEAMNQGGAGALIGTLHLGDNGFQFANGGQTLETDTADWVASLNDVNNAITPQPWVTPTGAVISYGFNGITPWGFNAGFDASARWIDGSIGLGGCGNCTVDFSTPIFSATTTPEPATLWLLGIAFSAAGLFRRRNSR